MMKYTVKKGSSPYITLYELNEKNQKGENLLIELVECTSLGDKKSLPYLWYKSGYTDKILYTYLSIHTYCTDSEGNCSGKYNPQTKQSEDGKRNVIDFEWLFENTEENKQKLINECIRLFESATGKSATEIKMEKIKQFAKENDLDICMEIPEGWQECYSMTFPSGCTRIINCKRFKRINGKLKQNPNYKEAIYVY